MSNLGYWRRYMNDPLFSFMIFDRREQTPLLLLKWTAALSFFVFSGLNSGFRLWLFPAKE